MLKSESQMLKSKGWIQTQTKQYIGVGSHFGSVVCLSLYRTYIFCVPNLHILISQMYSWINAGKEIRQFCIFKDFIRVSWCCKAFREECRRVIEEEEDEASTQTSWPHYEHLDEHLDLDENNPGRWLVETEKEHLRLKPFKWPQWRRGLMVTAVKKSI